MGEHAIHLPSIKGRPACGVRRGVMALEIAGLRKCEVGIDLAAAYMPMVSCRRCLDAMNREGFARARRSWEFWLSGAIAGRFPETAEGCTYAAHVGSP